MDSGTQRDQPAGPADIGRSRRMQLHLGVIVLPYNKPGLTTYDVAGFLERKYGVIGAYFRVHGQDVARAVEGSLAGALESLTMGQRIAPWERGMQAIEQGFRTFISSREAERVGIPGTPTKAALMGVSHRFASPRNRKNPRRPSFRDTGMYMNSFRAWVS